MCNFELDDDETEVTEKESVEECSTTAELSGSQCDADITFPVKQEAWIKFAQTFINGRSRGRFQETQHVSFILEQSFNTWVAECSCSIKLFESAHHARQTVNVGRNLSLVCMPVLADDARANTSNTAQFNARFIHWQVPGQLGRPIELDHQNRVKALVCVGKLREPTRLTRETGAAIVHPDVGVAMQRARGYQFGERPSIPADMLRSHSMCDLALQVQQDSEESRSAMRELGSADVCAVCHHKVFDTDVTKSIMGQGSLFQCPSCLLLPGSCKRLFWSVLVLSIFRCKGLLRSNDDAMGNDGRSFDISGVYVFRRSTHYHKTHFHCSGPK